METKKSVLMICGDFMEDYEAAVPFYVLPALGFDVHCVSPDKVPGDKCLTAVHDFQGFELYTELPGHNFYVTHDFTTVNADLYSGLVIPGGRFTELLSAHDATLAVVGAFAAARKPIMTTCHSQLILAAAGALKGMTCTAFFSMRLAVELGGGTWEDPRPFTKAVVDRNVVSAIGWPAHAELLGRFVECAGGKISSRRGTSVLILCGDYVEDYEINVPFQALTGLGCNVVVACPTKSKDETCVTAIHDDEGHQICTEKRGHNFVVTSNWADVRSKDFDCLVVPGGRSPELLVDQESVVGLVREFAEQGKVVAGIGMGQLLLAAAGLLKGKRCASSYGMKAIVKLAGGEVVESDESLADGKLITATGWSALSQFISDIMNLLELSVTY